MRLSFPATAIASISGTALLATLAFAKNDQVAATVNAVYDKSFYGSVRDPSKTDGRECLVSGIASKRQNVRVDTGVLGCGLGEACVQDETSSFGGRCVVLEEQEVAAHAHRNLATSCTFANGTAGTKCDGSEACYGLNISNVGCGSCNGYYACYVNSNTVVGEGSCIGKYACFSDSSIGSIDIGSNSCLGERACNDLGSSSIPISIGSNSCHGKKACKETTCTNISDSLCNVAYSCYKSNSNCTAPTSTPITGAPVTSAPVTSSPLSSAPVSPVTAAPSTNIGSKSSKNNKGGKDTKFVKA